MVLGPGTLIAGQYRVERKIAEGGMGEVWVGLTAAGLRVAIKRLLPEAAGDHQVVTRFKREALLLGRIQSDHVAHVVEFLTDPTFGLVLVMEYVAGEPLADVLEKRGRFEVEDALDLGIDLAHAVADLHRASIVHRDIKPENVILRPLPGGKRRAVLIDFGLSRLLDAHEDRKKDEETLTGITRADMAVGTIPYMAPEQIVSSRDVNRAADIYALGAILFRAATGKHVFGDVDDMTYARTKLISDPPPLELARFDRAARELERIVARALKRRPAERYESAEAMLSELLQARGASRPARGEEGDEPTQHAPVSSLLGFATAQTEALDLETTTLAMSPPRPATRPAAPVADEGFERTMLARRTLDDAIQEMPTVPPPPGPRGTNTVPIPPATSPADNAPAVARASMPSGTFEPPPGSLRFAPPPMPPPPSTASPASLRGSPVPQVPAVAQAPAQPSPAQPSPAQPAPGAPGFSGRTAILAVVGALVAGFLLGFVTHAATADTPAPARCPDAPQAGATKH